MSVTGACACAGLVNAVVWGILGLAYLSGHFGGINPFYSVITFFMCAATVVAYEAD